MSAIKEELQINDLPEKEKWKLLKRKIEPSDWLRIGAIIIVLGLLTWAGVAYTKYFGSFDTGDLVTSAKLIKEYITVDYPHIGLPIMFFLQIFHVVISFIPAALISFATGMIYGWPMAMLLGSVGATIGSIISFYLARILGRKVVTLFVKQKNMDKLENMLSGDMSMFVLLILFFLPTPKDFFSYFLGLTSIKAWKYFIISAIGRLPGMFITCYLGATIANRNYAVMIGCVVFMVVAVTIMFFLKDKIFALLKKEKPAEVIPAAQSKGDAT